MMKREEGIGKREEKRRKKGNKRENIIILFPCLMKVGLYDRQKVCKKNRKEIQQHLRGVGGGICLGGLNIYP